MIFSSVVPGNVVKSVSLVDYLCQRFTYHDALLWRFKIDEGKVCIDGKPASSESVIHGGQTIMYDAGEFDEPPADLNYSIIYEDDWLLAINKPGNLLIHRAGISFKNNLMYHLRNIHNPPYPEANSIHRLDRNTSGIVLIAKNRSILSKISDQFKSMLVKKSYTAMVEGVLTVSVPSTICKPISNDASSQNGCRFRIDTNGKEAVTTIVTCEPIGNSCSLLTLQPITGRTHQIRVHCSSIGHPIIGDKLYGSMLDIGVINGRALPVDQFSALHPRHALHCCQLCFYHPLLEEKLVITAELPGDLDLLKNKLSKGTH